MTHGTPLRLEPPSLRNFTCSSPFLSILEASWPEYLKAASLVFLSLGIIATNGLLVVTLLSRRHSRFLQSQPRYLLTSLACGNLGVGVLVAPLGVFTSIVGCWPYGEVLCSAQALLVGALCQQNAATLVCMAADRYMCMLHPVTYHKLLSKKGSFGAICFTWVASFSLYVALIVPGNGYFFNSQGIPICEPFYRTNTVAILAACLFYFPPTMVLLYCYGSVFQLARVKLKKVKCNAIARPEQTGGVSVEKLIMEERRRSMRTSRSLAGMGLAFIAIVTPWTIKQVVTSCTGVEVPPLLDFMVTWLALSNGIWNVLIYTLLSKSFRKSALDLLCSQIFCCKTPLNSEEIESHICSANSHLTSPRNDFGRLNSASADDHASRMLNDGPLMSPSSEHARRQPNFHLSSSTSMNGPLSLDDSTVTSSTGLLSNHGCSDVPSYHNHHFHGHDFGPDWDRIGERFWGEILERTVSSTSLQNLQRIYRPDEHHCPNQSHLARNGGVVHHNGACAGARGSNSSVLAFTGKPMNRNGHHPERRHQIQKELFLHNRVLHQKGCPVAGQTKTSTGTMTNPVKNTRSVATSSFSDPVDSETSPVDKSAPIIDKAKDGDSKRKPVDVELNNLNTISSKISLIHGDGPTIPLRVMQEGRVWEMGV